MRTSVIVCLFAGYAALLSARVGGAPSPSATPADAEQTQTSRRQQSPRYRRSIRRFRSPGRRR